MAETSKIEWTHATFNPWIGCTKVSAGCANCYAETLMGTRWGKVKWGPHGTRVIASEAAWRQPLKWDRAAAKAGERRRVFCASLADVFEERPELVEPRMRLFKLIGATPNLDWLLLTKRPEVAVEHWPLWAGYAAAGQLAAGVPIGRLSRGFVIPNVWLGVSVEDQQRADERIPHLLRTPAAVRFLSVEPLLGPVDLGRWMNDLDVSRDEDGSDLGSASGGSDLDWVIVGGESGHNVRPLRVEWVRSIVRRCRVAGVACFVKQLGSHPIETEYTTTASGTRGQVVGLRMADHKGGNPAEWPADLRVREFPTVAN